MPGIIAPPRARPWVTLLPVLGLLWGGVASAQGSATSHSTSTSRAAGWLRAAMETMGGEARLRGLEGIRIEGVGHTNYLEQSERFEGPYVVRYEQLSELRDVKRGRIRQTTLRRTFDSPRFTGATLVVTDGVAVYEVPARDGKARIVPADADQRGAAERRLALAPERVLLLALEAPDLRAARDTVYYGVPHHVVTFGARGGSVRLFLNAYTTLPTAVESRRAESENFFWGVWGDVTLRTLFSLWTLEPGGLLYPRQWDVEWDGKPYSSTTVTALDLRAAVPADSFAITDEARTAFGAAVAKTSGPKTIGLGELWGSRRTAGPIEELKPGVVFIPGGYNVVLVRQSDGIVILEAPFSPEYSAKVLDEVARRFPGERVKAVVSTGDAWTYLGGAREYVARGVPVYALRLNRPILERVVQARHDIDPDSLARAPRKAEFRWVNGKTVLGAGPNRMELHAVNGEAGERMMLVYFPEHRLLWTSDLVQGPRANGTFFMPEYLLEVQWVVKRERLQVETAFGMHRPPIAWSRITAALDAQQRPSPAGRVDTLRIASAVAGDTMDVRVYLPPGYDSGRSYPVVYAVARQVYFDPPQVALPLVLDSAIRAGLPPAVVVALPFGRAVDAHHPDTPAGRAWQRSVVEEVLPEIERRYAVGRDRAERHLLGFSSGANVVVDLAVRYPSQFARVAAQSPGWMDRDGERSAVGRVFLPEAIANVRAATGGSLPAFWFVWGDGHMEWEARSRENGEAMLAALRERGARVVRADPVAGEHGLQLVTESLRSALHFLLATERR